MAVDTNKPFKVGIYIRLAKEEPPEEEKKLPLPADFFEQFLKEQEVLSCRRYRLLSR